MGTSKRTPVVVAKLVYNELETVSEITFMEVIEEIFAIDPWVVSNRVIDLNVGVVGFQRETSWGSIDIHLNFGTELSSSQEAAFEAMVLRICTGFANTLDSLCGDYTMHVDISYLTSRLDFYSHN